MEALELPLRYPVYLRHIAVAEVGVARLPLVVVLLALPILVGVAEAELLVREAMVEQAAQAL